MSPATVRLFVSTLTTLVTLGGGCRCAHAQVVTSRHGADGVYDRFDGDLDLGLGLGAELGSAGRAAPLLLGSAHYFSMAGMYAAGRVRAGDGSAPSLFALGIDLRPLFVPRWSKGFETGPALLDLTLDSLSLSLGAFWAAESPRAAVAGRGFEVGLGFGVPLFARAHGPWLEARGQLRYPDRGARQDALLLLVAWHGFVTTPFSESSGL